MRILIAPDKFKDALDAAAVAKALAAGVREAAPDAELDLCPLGDGGEGTGQILAAALGARPQRARVLDPLGRPRAATWWLQPPARERLATRGAGPLAIVEMAEASGLALLSRSERDALRTTSFGTGQLLRAAQDAGAMRVLLCVGGSATVDGGAGCLQALGWRFFNAAGAEWRAPIAGGALTGIARVAPPDTQRELAVEILCDVENPLLGPRGAAAIFGPQKGAGPAAVDQLERGLTLWADLLESAGATIRTLPGGGAAGGIAAGLIAALGARIVPGFDEVARHVRLAERLVGCDLCLTGEGRLDEQTLGGKVVGGVARLAREWGVRTVALVGAMRLQPGQTVAELTHAVGLDAIIAITPANTPLPQALAQTRANLTAAARKMLL